MARILVLGSAGMAGHVIYTLLKEQSSAEIFGTVHLRKFSDADIVLNIYDKNRLKEIVAKVHPDIVINCIGVLIKGAKSNPANAIYSNAYFPHLLAEVCNKMNCKVIHISTDCVFSGRDGTYTENSPKDAVDTYGISKGLGEIIDEKNLTIRTSIIGPELSTPGEGLFDWFIRQTGKVNGYKSAIWSGITTLELGRFILWVLDKPLVGLVHLTNNKPIDKFNLLKILATTYNNDVRIVDEHDHAVDKSFKNTNQEIQYLVPSYNEMLYAQKEFMKKHEDFYPHYTCK